MKKYLCIMAMGLALTACMKNETPPVTQTSAVMALTTDRGVGKEIGRVVFTDTAHGLQINVNLKGLPSGELGFHVHEKASCAPMMTNGKIEHAMMAGGHYDPLKTGKHLGPEGGGHRGDLPALHVDKSGSVQVFTFIRGVTAAEFQNRALMIHAGGDNYSDEPLPLGGGGARIACGIIK